MERIKLFGKAVDELTELQEKQRELTRKTDLLCVAMETVFGVILVICALSFVFGSY
jgi:hypothetical protein